MKLNCYFLLIMAFIVAVSCEETSEIKPSTKPNSAKVVITSLANEPQLERVLDIAGFRSVQSKNARSNEEGEALDIDEILKVVQEDSVHHTFTFKIESNTIGIFSNLLIEENADGSYLAFILTYEFEGHFDFNNYSGQIKRFDLAGKLLRELNFINGEMLAAENASQGKGLQDLSDCLTGVTKHEACLEWGTYYNTQGPQETCVRKALVVTFEYGDCSSYEPTSPDDGTSAPYGGGTTISGPGSPTSGSTPDDDVDGENDVQPIPGYNPKKPVAVIPVDEEIITSVNQLLEEDPTALLEIDCNQVPKWQALAQYKPSEAIKNKINELDQNAGLFNDWAVQTLNGANGTIVNMDYFPVNVKTLPKNPSTNQTFTPEAFLDYFRRNINNFAEGSTFSPYCETTALCNQETALWNSANPTGAIVYIDIPVDDGVVICSESTSSYWNFTTLEAPGAGNHPVSGTRQFGFEPDGSGGYNFFVRGVDRFDSNIMENSAYMVSGGAPFDGADDLWSSFQKKLNAFINDNGGNATVTNSAKYRPDWNKVDKVLKGKRPISDLGCR